MEIDTSKPNAGRIYDYLLGGHHNFEADRVAADRLVQLLPGLPKWMRLNRWFLLLAADELAAAGFNCYIDLATGLPTQGYLHEHVPRTARLIYNDADPTTVAYAREVVSGWDNIRYVQSDIRRIDTVLKEAETFFGGERLVGICLIGVIYFIEDESAAQILQRLYDWAAPGSRLAISFISVEQPMPSDEPALQMYRQINTPVYPRTPAEIMRLMRPWQPYGQGLRPLTAYVEAEMGIPLEIEQTESKEMMVGGMFEKPAA